MRERERMGRVEPEPELTYRPAPRASQARPRGTAGPYAIALVAIVALLGLFAFLGVRWVTGDGKSAGLTLATPEAILPPGASVIPSPSPSASPLPSPSPATTQRTYTVKAGDTPGSIARDFGVDPQALLQLNGNPDPKSLQIGQTLKIPPSNP